MKTLANCNPVDFLRQTNRIRNSFGSLLTENGIPNIFKRQPELKGTETADEAREKRRAQTRRNVDEILNILMEMHAEETAEALGLMCFMEPDELANAKGVDLLSPAIELLSSKPVIDFFMSFAKLGRSLMDG